MKNDLPSADSTLHPVELAPLQSAPTGTPISAAGVNIGALAAVQARVSIVAGHVDTTVGDLLSLRDGVVMTLDTALNAPFDLVLNDSVIARGELVAVDDHFGIRITQVATAK